jgi:hypothetical protein
VHAPGLPNRQAQLQARQRADNWGKIGSATMVFVSIFLGTIGLILITGLILAWPVMIALGIWHSYFPAVPPLGWLASFISVVAVHAAIHGQQRQKTAE